MPLTPWYMMIAASMGVVPPAISVITNLAAPILHHQANVFAKRSINNARQNG